MVQQSRGSGTPLPLKDVPEAVITKFNEEVKFENGGCAHAYYQDLKGALSEDQFNAVLAALGLTPQKFTDIRDAFCDGGDCRSRPGYWCNTDFCH